MNKLDSIYYEAVTRATEDGVINPDSLRVLLESARKFVVIDELGEAARFFERIFSLWRTVAPNQATMPVSLRAEFASALAEYIQLLTKLERHERIATIYEAMPPTK